MFSLPPPWKNGVVSVDFTLNKPVKLSSVPTAVQVSLDKSFGKKHAK